MFTFIRNLYTYIVRDDDRILFGDEPTTPISENNDMVATIQPVANHFGLFDKEGLLVAEYSRRRDAKRGAERRGWQVA